MTRPSESVVAWKLGGWSGAREQFTGDGTWTLDSVKVQDMPAAGVPLRVLRTWQVMGSRSAIVLEVLRVPRLEMGMIGK